MHEGGINLKIRYKSNHEQNGQRRISRTRCQNSNSHKTASKNTKTNNLITARLTWPLQGQQAHSHNNNMLQSYHARKSQQND